MDVNFSAIVGRKRKFRLPKLVRAAAYEAWARCLSANFGRPGLCRRGVWSFVSRLERKFWSPRLVRVWVPRAADDEIRTRPRPQKSDYEINACSR